MRIREIWDVENCLVVHTRELTNVTCQVLGNWVGDFFIFRSPYTGILWLEGNIEDDRVKDKSDAELLESLADLANVGITGISGFNDMSFTFSPTTLRLEQVKINAIVPNTQNTFFARLISAKEVVEIEDDVTMKTTAIAAENFTAPYTFVRLEAGIPTTVAYKATDLLNVDGLAIGVINANSQCDVFVHGALVTVPGTLEIGKDYYLDSNFELTSNIPTNISVLQVGKALSSTQLVLNLEVKIIN